MLLPVANRPGWLQDSETQELWVPIKLFCKIICKKPKSLYTAKSIHSSKYRFMKLGGHLLVNWTLYQAQAKLCITGNQTSRLPGRDILAGIIQRPPVTSRGGNARQTISRIRAECKT